MGVGGTDSRVANRASLGGQFGMSGGSTAHTDVATGIELLSAWIEEQMAQRGEPGLSIGIIHDQELVWARGFGYADLNEQIPATAATRYRIASITKLFTGTGILMLRDAGMLQPT